MIYSKSIQMDATKLQSQMSQMASLTSMAAHDITSLSAGTKRAATDARKRMSEISKLATQMRAECLVVQKSIPTKSRKKVAAEVDGEPETQAIEDLADELPEKLALERTKPRGRKPRAR